MKTINKEEFSLEVITFANMNDLSYIDSLQYFVEKYEIDLIIVNKLIDNNLRGFLTEEAESLNIVKKTHYDIC